MRYDTGHKQKTREIILKVAARELRLLGPQKLGVSTVMGNAGLTHGGFYAHFASKESLIVAAISHMFAEAVAFLDSQVEGQNAGAGLSAYINLYLSSGHRDGIEKGCPIVALASDVPRLPEKARQAFTDGLRHLLEAIENCLKAMGVASPEEAAISLMNEMVGALTLARAEPDIRRSGDILEISRRLVKARLGVA